MKLTLLQTPNQRLPIFVGKHDIELTTSMFGGNLYATISIDGEVAVGSRRVVLDDDLMGYSCLTRRFGTLRFRAKYGEDVTQYADYNSSIYLEYLPADV